MSFKDKLSSFLFHPKKEELPEEALPEDAVTVSFARCPEEENWRVITMEGVGPV